MTVGELGARMTAAELAEWQAHDILDVEDRDARAEVHGLAAKAEAIVQQRVAKRRRTR